MPGIETTKLWTQRLRRYDQADMTVAEFCDSEGVSQPSFYSWRRKLRMPAVTTKRQPPAQAAVFLPVALPSPVHPTRSGGPSHSVTTIELPGGIRIRVETPIDQDDTTTNVVSTNSEASR